MGVVGVNHHLRPVSYLRNNSPADARGVRSGAYDNLNHGSCPLDGRCSSLDDIRPKPS